MCVAILVFPRFNLYKRKSAGKRDMVACLSPISGLSSLNLYYYRASPGVATRHAEVRALRAAFALMRTQWDFDTKVLVPTAH